MVDNRVIEASRKGQTEILSFFLENGLNVNAKYKDGRTALIEAVTYGQTKIVPMLIEKGADVNEKDKDGRTALIWASWEGHMDIVSMLLKMSIIPPLKAIDIDAKDKHHNTAFIEASWNGRINIVKILLEKGVNVNAKNSLGNTALELARKYGHTEIVSLIKKHMILKTALIIKKGLTQKGNKPLVPYAHRETIHRIVSFF